MSELATVIARLDLISQVSAAPLGRSARDQSGDIGGNAPSGGIDWQGDRELDYPQKSAEYFRRRVRRAPDEKALRVILHEAHVALRAAHRQPLDRGEPEYGSPQWKRWVSECGLSHGEIARKYNVSRFYVQKIRRLYGNTS